MQVVIEHHAMTFIYVCKLDSQTKDRSHDGEKRK